VGNCQKLIYPWLFSSKEKKSTTGGRSRWGVAISFLFPFLFSFYFLYFFFCCVFLFIIFFITNDVAKNVTTPYPN